MDEYLKHVADFIKGVGLLFYFCGFKIDRTKLLVAVFIINSVLSIPFLFEISERFGLDYSSYLQQMSAVYQGQMDYTKLSSTQGPCYYPAGHIYHYMFAYILHNYTEDAEVIMKAVHIVLHSAILMITIKVAFIYFADEVKDKENKAAEVKYDENKSSNGQLIAFLMLGSRHDRVLWGQMHND